MRPLREKPERNLRRRRDREGYLLVEFVGLLPLMALCALLMLVFQEMMLRQICNSHAAFTAARRWAVGGVDSSYIARHYAGASMRGHGEVSQHTAESRPKVMTVSIRDVYNIRMPTGKTEGASPVLETVEFRDLQTAEQAAGSSLR